MNEKLNMNLASNPQEEHSHSVSELGNLQEKMCHLSHDLQDVRVELVRTTEGLRSLSIVLTKLDLGNAENKIVMKISELKGGVEEIKTVTLRAFSEIRNRIDAADARIETLIKQLADADVPPEAETALNELKTISKQLDDIVPDTPELPPVVPPPTPA